MPSISEDDELSPSDEEDDDDKATSVAEKVNEEDELESLYPSPSINSPLLPPPRLFQKLPNGDIAVDSLNRYTRPSNRAHTNP